MVTTKTETTHRPVSSSIATAMGATTQHCGGQCAAGVSRPVPLPLYNMHGYVH